VEAFIGQTAEEAESQSSRHHVSKWCHASKQQLAARQQPSAPVTKQGAKSQPLYQK
jgi:hypothetical protein